MHGHDGFNDVLKDGQKTMLDVKCTLFVYKSIFILYVDVYTKYFQLIRPLTPLNCFIDAYF